MSQFRFCREGLNANARLRRHAHFTGLAALADKEGGDSEKKMTKDFLDRWKKIASKYEGPEDEAAKAKEAEKGEAPRPGAPPPVEAAPTQAPDKAPGGEHEDELDLDDLMVDFGLQDEGAAKA